MRYKKKPKKKIKRVSLKSLRKRAWKLISEYVRRAERGICFTCGRKKNWREQDCGHYIHRDSLDYDLVNIHCQCTFCNRFLHGNLGVYAERLIAEYGEEAIIALRQRGNVVRKFTITELEEYIADYKQKIKELGGILCKT